MPISASTPASGTKLVACRPVSRRPAGLTPASSELGLMARTSWCRTRRIGCGCVDVLADEGHTGIEDQRSIVIDGRDVVAVLEDDLTHGGARGAGDKQPARSGLYDMIFATAQHQDGRYDLVEIG